MSANQGFTTASQDSRQALSRVIPSFVPRLLVQTAWVWGHIKATPFAEGVPVTVVGLQNLGPSRERMRYAGVLGIFIAECLGVSVRLLSLY